MGRFSADIAVETQTADTITYRASFTKGKPGTASLWVFQAGKDSEGNVVRAENQPVVGEESGSGVSQPFNITPFVDAEGVSHTIATAEAYVWVFPDSFTPISATLVTSL